MEKYTCDFLICGGGMVGLSIAYQLIERNISKKIIILDKEPELGLHSSGRNSGVLHAGIYYEPHSLKARVCVSGASRLKKWIKERKIKINNCGKLIIPQEYSLDKQLDVLYERGIKNGAKIEFVDSGQIKKFAPDANILSGRALWSPGTSVVDSFEIISILRKELESKGVKFFTEANNWTLNKFKTEVDLHNGIKIIFDHFINSSGLQADKVAHKFSIAKEYKIIPFKGIYWKLRNDSPFKFKVNLYPVPDLNVPFLGVHFTPNVSNNAINIGPTAIPAFGRENYNLFEKIEPLNLISDMKFLSNQYFSNRGGFRKYVNEQALLGFPLLFLNAAKKLIPKLKYNHIEPSKKVGIRAQLFNIEKKEIIKDFLCIKGKNSTHIINTISPAFTASFALADLIIDNYLFEEAK